MTQEDLRERIKNELVLHEGNIADWQWNRTGLPAEATELGLPDFSRLVEDVSRSLNTRFSKILDLQAAIQKAGAENEKHLSALQIDLFAQDADRLGLSRAFVTEQWIPSILILIPDSKPSVVLDQLDSPTENAELTVSKTNTSDGEDQSVLNKKSYTLRQEVYDNLAEYHEHVTAYAIRGIIASIDCKKETLAWYVHNYLSDNKFVAENKVRGTTFYTMTTSTDWWHPNLWTKRKLEIKSSIQNSLAVHKEYISAKEIRDLLASINYDQDQMAEIVSAYLVANSFLPVRKTRAVKVYNRITSTDWRRQKQGCGGIIAAIVFLVFAFLFFKSCSS